MKLYVGNLSVDTTENDLQNVFSQFGSVVRLSLVIDIATGHSRGFAFVTMASSAEGNAAIAALEGKEVQGQNLKVTEACPREARPLGSGSRRSYGGGRRY